MEDEPGTRRPVGDEPGAAVTGAVRTGELPPHAPSGTATVTPLARFLGAE